MGGDQPGLRVDGDVEPAACGRVETCAAGRNLSLRNHLQTQGDDPRHVLPRLQRRPHTLRLRELER